jgi:hypothetical protein
VTEDERVSFILQTNLLERSALKEEQVRSSMLMPQTADPLVSGQMRCLAMLPDLAQDPNLIPKPSQISEATFDQLFPWLKLFHGNLLYDLALKGEKLLNEVDYPRRADLAQYRTEDKVLGHRRMPNPFRVKPLLVEAFRDYSKIYDEYRTSLGNPRILEEADWKKLEQAAYKLNLSICCIKPFNDGSNRVARLVENLARLNIGLRFKILADKDKLLNDIWKLQDSVYKSVD